MRVCAAVDITRSNHYLVLTTKSAPARPSTRDRHHHHHSLNISRRLTITTLSVATQDLAVFGFSVSLAPTTSRALEDPSLNETALAAVSFTYPNELVPTDLTSLCTLLYYSSYSSIMYPTLTVPRLQLLRLI